MQRCLPETLWRNGVDPGAERSGVGAIAFVAGENTAVERPLIEGDDLVA